MHEVMLDVSLLNNTLKSAFGRDDDFTESEQPQNIIILTLKEKKTNLRQSILTSYSLFIQLHQYRVIPAQYLSVGSLDPVVVILDFTEFGYVATTRTIVLLLLRIIVKCKNVILISKE